MKKNFLIVLFLIFISTESFACSCGGRHESLSKQVKRSFDNTDLIFTGKVIKITEINNSLLKSSADPIIYTFEIIQVIKGQVQKKNIEIASAISSASCGYNFRIGKSYLVYSRKSTRYSKLTKNKFYFSTSLCSRNQFLSKVSKKEFRKLKELNTRKEKYIKNSQS